jgi:hypothetical protein
MIFYLFKVKSIIFLISRISSYQEQIEIEEKKDDFFRLLIENNLAETDSIIIFSLIRDYNESTINLILPSTNSNEKVINKLVDNTLETNNLISETIINNESTIKLVFENNEILLFYETNILNEFIYFYK